MLHNRNLVPVTWGTWDGLYCNITVLVCTGYTMHASSLETTSEDRVGMISFISIWY